MFLFDESFGIGVGDFVRFLRAIAEQDHWSESSDFNRVTPAPNPGLTWIISAHRNVHTEGEST